MRNLELLKNEVDTGNYKGLKNIRNIILYKGYKKQYNNSRIKAKALAKKDLFSSMPKKVYRNDLVLGSIAGLFSEKVNDKELSFADEVCESYGVNTFLTNADHFTPDFEYFLQKGIGGVLLDIKNSMEKHKCDSDKLEFLDCCKITLEGLSAMISGYADEAFKLGKFEEGKICRKISKDAPESFREALQLVWLTEESFFAEGRYAMALGRMDTYLYPYYEKDIKSGSLTPGFAEELLACTFLKIDEHRLFANDEEVVNICIGGEKREGGRAENELSYLILNAVKRCAVSGPNLSARVSPRDSDKFFDACLDVIGSGIGYPALINDEVNIPALQKYGYSLEDCRDYSMVGCIESFISGKQPPWSDGRFNIPLFVEYALNSGRSFVTDARLGFKTADAESIDTMEKFLESVKTQLKFGADEYAALFNNRNDMYNPRAFSQPYLSCFCRSCIERGTDIREGGAVYKSVHGVGLTGMATAADSLAAIEEVVFNKNYLTLSELRDILKNNFEGRKDVKAMLISAPKYGNNLELADKYAVYLLDLMSELFKDKKTRDGGRFYLAMASNVQNISAGQEVGASADGRESQKALSDAASPMRGRDVRGLTALIHSVTKLDYKKCACGTVINLKFTENFFKEKSKRDKLREALRVYFERGGQEFQINCVSRRKLRDAMEHPENYEDLVVRVSGFSAFYTRLDRAVQLDILERTEHE